jgi:hypothetical protein
MTTPAPALTTALTTATATAQPLAPTPRAPEGPRV